MRSGKERLIGLDLLRALAISAVLTCHIGVYALHLDSVWLIANMGAFGVDLFFALSGFLIGGLLLEILDRGVSFRAWKIFMLRRWLRTLPLYITWIGVLSVIAPLEDPLVSLKYIFLLQNLAWPMPHWFPVSWSLTVEEWFYLLFSGLLMCLATRNRSVALSVAISVFLLAPLLLRLNLSVEDMNWADWDSKVRKVAILRLDAIVYGVLIAVLYRRRPDRLYRWRHSALCVGILIAAFPFTPAAYLLGMWWKAVMFNFVSLGLALTIPWALSLSISPIFTRTFITWLAERSYCLYIVHLTLVQFVSSAVTIGQIPSNLTVPSILALCAVIADLSFRFFETPILRRRPPQFSVPEEGVVEETVPRFFQVTLMQRASAFDSGLEATGEDKGPPPVNL